MTVNDDFWSMLNRLESGEFDEQIERAAMAMEFEDDPYDEYCAMAPWE